MIAKCTKGRSAHGGLAYDVGPGRAEEHRNPHEVGGTVAGRSWRERAYAMDEHARAARPDVQRPIHRTALRIADEDRRLTDKEWRQVAQRYVDEMGFKDCPWTAMKHGDEHIHVTVCRVQWNGTVASDAHDYRRSHSAARAIERDHGLIDASDRSNPGRPQVHTGERTRADRTGVTAPRDVLRDRVRDAVTHARGTRDSYETGLRERGVVFVANESSTGRMNGYRYGLGGDRDGGGDQIWFKGSQLGRDFRWAAVQQQLTDRDATRLAAAPAGPGRVVEVARPGGDQAAALRGRVDDAIAASDGTRAGFEDALSRRGVEVAANEARTGRMNGYRYRLTDQPDVAEPPAWWKGSELGKQYSWSRINAALEQRGDEFAAGQRDRDQARDVMSQLHARRGMENPEATREPSQEAASRLTPAWKGQDQPMQQETRPAGVTDPQHQAKGHDMGQPPADDAAAITSPESEDPARRQAADLVQQLRQARAGRERHDEERER